MKTVIIVQARMTSTRLPGKVLKEVLNKPLLEFQIERLRKVQLADELVIATTINETDQPIVDLCNRLNVPCFRGSETDVLSRYYFAANMFRATNIVRVTSDCPLIDPNIVNNVIYFYLENYPKYDYVSNTLNLTYPRGMDTEIFSFKSLSEAYSTATRDYEREHVTPFLYQDPERYRLYNYSYFDNMSDHRWTVDTPEDFSLIRLILEELYPKNDNFSLEDCLLLCKQHPEWKNLNEGIKQKQIK